MALVLTVDGVDRTSLLCRETLRINQTSDGLNSTCVFDLMDDNVIRDGVWTVGVTRIEDGDVITGYVTLSIDAKVEVSVVDGAEVYFAGILSSITTLQMGKKARVLQCACHDFNQMLEEDVVDSLEEYASKTDEQIIDDIFLNYVTGIDSATFVDGGDYTFDEISFENMTVRQVMDAICAQSGCTWYIDYSKKMHYSPEEDNALGWFLDDSPDQVSSFSYFDDFQRKVDGVNLVNRVFVIGSVTSAWYEDAASIADYDTHQAIIRDTSIVDEDDLEARGDAILAKYKDPEVSYHLGTYKTGARAGMHVRLVNALYDVDSTFLINSLAITFPLDKDPKYHLVCGGLRSSGSAASRRLELDKLNDAGGLVGGEALALASRGWGHDMAFSATDKDTVAWTAGTITTVGGITFSIDAGDTDDPGAMVAKTIVYLDTAISLTVLQMTTDETAALGNNRIMVAVCWPTAEATSEAGFQVFGASSGGEQTYLNADNVAANAITANEIYVNSLSAIEANMGTLTSGKIQTAAAGNNRVVLDTAFGLKGISAADVTQFHLDITDGKARFGADTVTLDEDGVTIVDGEGAANQIKWHTPGGTIVGGMYVNWDGGVGDKITTYLHALDWVSGAGAEVYIAAYDDDTGIETKLVIASNKTINATHCTDFILAEGAVNWVDFTYGGNYILKFGDAVGGDKFQILSSLGGLKFQVDSAGACTVPGNLGVTLDATAANLISSGTIKTNANVTWDMAGAVAAAPPAADRKIHVKIAGAWYTLHATNGLV